VQSFVQVHWLLSTTWYKYGANFIPNLLCNPIVLKLFLQLGANGHRPGKLLPCGNSCSTIATAAAAWLHP